MSTIADAARLARFLVAADTLARVLGNHEPGDDNCRNGATTAAALGEYAEARKAFVGPSPFPPPIPQPPRPPFGKPPNTGNAR